MCLRSSAGVTITLLLIANYGYSTLKIAGFYS